MPGDSSSSASRLRYPPAIALALGLIAAAATALAQAQEPANPAVNAGEHPTGHVHDHGDLTFPPQPRGITNAVTLGDVGAQTLAAEARERRAAAQERIAILRSDVRRALGARFARTAFEEEGDRSGTPGVSRLVYFSYSKNATVEVTTEGERVREITSVPAAEYQPEITDEEIAEAERIARAHFRARSVGRVEQLQAFGILAYHTRGKGFYDTRVLYLTFHPDADAPPEYAAWVDLSKRRVLRVREERR